jgi:hypothetical protein
MHRAAYLARLSTAGRLLLTTFSKTLASRLSEYEQPNGAVSQRIVVSRDIRSRHGERLYRIDPFAPGPERLAAGGNDVHRRAGPQYSLGHRCSGVDHMLAGIQDKQQAPVGERLRHALRRSFGAAKLQPDSGSYRGRDQPGIGEGRELGQPHAIGKVRPQLACKRESQRCLPDAAGAGHRYEPVRGDEIQDLAELLFPADQLGNRLWYVGRRQDRCGLRRDRANGLAGTARISPVNW